MKRTVALLALAACAAACSNGVDPVPVTPSDAPSTSAAATPTTPAATTAAPSEPAATPTAKPSAAPSACAGLKIAPGDSQGAAGTIYTRFVVTNKGAAPCTLEGRPRAQAYKGGKPLPGAKIAPIDADDPNFGETPAATTLAAGSGTAVFFVVYGTAPVGDAPCRKADGLVVTAPGAPASATVPFAFTTCGSPVQISAIYPPSKTL